MNMVKSRTTILWALVVALVATPAAADTFVCEDGFCVFGAGDVLDNVVVRGDGILLLLDGAAVTGNIRVEEGGVLAASGVLIEGNVVAHEAVLIDLVLSSVEGNVQIKRTGGAPVFGLLPSVDLLSCDVGGNVQIQDNEVNFIDLEGNDIGGNLELKKNLALLRIRVDENVIEGNLHCRNNDPAPSGSGNVVVGNVSGQCEALGF